MMHSNILTFATVLASFILPTYAGIKQSDFTGIGRIYVLESDDWRTATPNSTVGCLDEHGKFVENEAEKDCGVFTRLADYPYTLSTSQGNCTFDDDTQEKNTDSRYGKTDNAWNCQKGWQSTIYDELYTIDGFPYVFLCFGDVACFYDGKHSPKAGESLSLWQYHWGSEQMGITPGHIQLQLMWEKIGDLPKRESKSEIPGPRVQVKDGAQMPLSGRRSKVL